MYIEQGTTGILFKFVKCFQFNLFLRLSLSGNQVWAGNNDNLEFQVQLTHRKTLTEGWGVQELWLPSAVMTVQWACPWTIDFNISGEG